MHRILFTAALLALAPACVHAQAAASKDSTSVAQPSPRKSHSPFGEVIRELTRAAQEQAAAKKAPTAPATAPAARDAAKPLPPTAGASPVLADSHRS